MNEKQALYNEICKLLTEYEEGQATKTDLYIMLVKIQNNWEDIITAQDN